MTILDCYMSLKCVQKILVVLGVVDTYVTPSVKIEAQFCINVTLCLGQNFPEIKVAVLGNLRQILCKLFGIHLIGLGELRQ